MVSTTSFLNSGVHRLLNELAGCKFVKVHRRNRGVQLAGIEIVQRFLYRKSSSLQSSSGLVFLSGGCFRCHKRQKQIARIHIRCAVAENFFVFSKSWDLQRPERPVAAEASPPLWGRKAALAPGIKIVYDKREGRSLLPPRFAMIGGPAHDNTEKMQYCSESHTGAELCSM